MALISRSAASFPASGNMSPTNIFLFSADAEEITTKALARQGRHPL
jgi:hypothetical protein